MNVFKSSLTLFVLATLITQNAFAFRIQPNRKEVVPGAPSNHVRVLESQGRISFQYCEGENTCAPLGRDSGYTRAELTARAKELNEASHRADFRAKARFFAVAAIGIVFAVARGGAAYMRNGFLPMATENSMFKSTAIGVLAGAGYSVSQSLLEPPYAGARDAINFTVLYPAPLTPDETVEYDHAFNKLVSGLNHALAGIK